MSSDITVAVRDISKTFYLTRSGSSLGLSRKSKRTEVKALQGVSFVGRRSESIGILGRNGSGKSTLMSIMAGGLSPSSGDVRVSAQPTLLSVSAALQSHLSGEQNARLGLLAQGISDLELDKQVEDLISWADLTEAAKRPLKTYSSGMKARLKFAIATANPTELLLIDEALSTGDSAFAAKARKRMADFMGNTGTVFLVSHSASTIRKHCNRALWLDSGRIIADGSVSEISRPYEQWNKLRAQNEVEKAAELVQKVSEGYQAPRLIFDSEAEAQLNYLPEGFGH